jgi:hypothetical protein
MDSRIARTPQQSLMFSRPQPSNIFPRILASQESRAVALPRDLPAPIFRQEYCLKSFNTSCFLQREHFRLCLVTASWCPKGDNISKLMTQSKYAAYFHDDLSAAIKNPRTIILIVRLRVSRRMFPLISTCSIPASLPPQSARLMNFQSHISIEMPLSARLMTSAQSG